MTAPARGREGISPTNQSVYREKNTNEIRNKKCLTTTAAAATAEGRFGRHAEGPEEKTFLPLWLCASLRKEPQRLDWGKPAWALQSAFKRVVCAGATDTELTRTVNPVLLSKEGKIC